MTIFIYIPQTCHAQNIHYMPSPVISICFSKSTCVELNSTPNSSLLHFPSSEPGNISHVHLFQCILLVVTVSRDLLQTHSGKQSLETGCGFEVNCQDGRDICTHNGWNVPRKTPDQKSVDPTQKQAKEFPRKTTTGSQTQSVANMTGCCGLSIKSEILSWLWSWVTVGITIKWTAMLPSFCEY